MRIVSVGTFVATVCLFGCVENAPRTGAPRTVTVEAIARDAGPSVDVAPVLAWVRDKQGAAWTFHLQAGGQATARVDGIRIATRHGEWAWTAKTLPVETEPCDMLGVPVQKAQGGTVTRGSLVSSDGREQVIVDPPTRCDDEHCANELRHDARPVASLGPYLFIEESTYSYACGAHGNTTFSFVVWDADRQRAVDVVQSLPEVDRVIADGKHRLGEAEGADSFGESAPQVTEVLPVLDRGQLAFEAQVTVPTCYACGDGRWSSYTRSVRVRVRPPAIFAEYTQVPVAVTTFQARHVDVTVAGWSETVPGTVPPKG